MRRTDMHRLVLVLMCGGLRGANTEGVLRALKKAGITADHFDVILGNSVGVPNAAFYMSGQFDVAYKMWTEIVPTPAFYSPRRVLKRGQEGLDLRFFRDEVLSHLDLDAFEAARPDLVVGLSKLSDGQEAYATADRDNVTDLISATCALPMLTYPVELTLNGVPELFFDGGVRQLLPIDKAFELGDRILVIATRTEAWRFKQNPFVRWGYVPFSRYRYATDAFDARARLYEYGLRRTQPGSWPIGKRVMIIHPDEDVEGGRMHNDPAISRRNIERGEALGERHVEEIRSFLFG